MKRQIAARWSGLLILTLMTSGADQSFADSPSPKVGQTTASQTLVWSAYEKGFDRTGAGRQAGSISVHCASADATEKRGALWQYSVNQKTASPVLIVGWSRAAAVGGTPNSDYSLYVDLEYQDGSHAFGAASPFQTGTHDWQRQQVLITPDSPLKTLLIYALFRRHTGEVWFDDFSLRSLSGTGYFDTQAVAPPRLPQGTRSGWFVRDVAAGGPLRPLTPGGASRLGLSLSPLRTDKAGRFLKTVLRSDRPANRAVTLYYVERFGAPHPVWWRSIRDREALSTSEGTNAVTSGGAGATGTQTRYPFGCVTDRRMGRVLALPPNLGPRLVRIGYHPGSHLLYLACDLAFTPERKAASLTVVRYAVSPEWGMRDAARIYYALFPAYYSRRTKAEGIWLPFTAPDTIPHVEDFGIAWHEGNNSVKADDALGILSFRYTEPMSFWMVMPPSEPRDYGTAFADLKRLADGETPATAQVRHQAMATLSSGSRAADGRLNVQFQNAPWANGAVWTLNPNSHMPGPWNKARVNYDIADADRRYGEAATGKLDGEYLDSLEGWSDVLDYSADSQRASAAPPTFATGTFRPVIPTWFSVWEYTDWLRADLHRRGKLLMANSTPWTQYAFMPLLDAAGTETNWLSGDGTYQPENDALLCLRRTLSGRKPYLLLQNTDFEKFGHADVESYFRRCLFYDIFPSFFSSNGADRPYWENAAWYDRDRDLFKRYIPIFKTLSAAGWEPITEAHSRDPDVFIERYGNRFLTVLNSGGTARVAHLRISARHLFPSAARAGHAFLAIRDGMTKTTLSVSPLQPVVGLKLPLQGSETRVIEMTVARVGS